MRTTIFKYMKTESYSSNDTKRQQVIKYLNIEH